MKQIQAILASVAAIAATVAGLDLTGFVTVLPPDLAKWLVIIPSAAAAVVHVTQTVKLELDKANAPKPLDFDRVPMFGMLAILAAVLFLPSCVTTTAPDGAVTERVDQEAVNPWLILARDLFVKPAPPVAPIVVEPVK